MLVEVFKILVVIIGVLMSLGHFPQAYRIYKRKSSKDVSLLTYLIFAVGSYACLIYGIIIMELPVIISFVVAVIGTTSVLVLIFKYR